jgi:hypothetical protein
VRLHGASWRRAERVKTPAEAAAPDIHQTDEGSPRHFWWDGPAPAADVYAYTKSGAWLRGDRNDFLEWLGKLYGYGVALPLTLVLGFLAWCIQRFHRVLALGVVVAVLWVTFPSWGGVDAAPSPATSQTAGVTP